MRPLLFDMCVDRRHALPAVLAEALGAFITDWIGADADDHEILALARRLDRFLVTEASDFGDLIYRDGLPPSPGVLLVMTQLIDRDERAARLAALVPDAIAVAEGHYPGRGRTKSGYLWALARDQRGWGGADPPGVVYFYADGRGGVHGERFLDGFRGTLQVDGYAGYSRLTRAERGNEVLTLAHCWSHARRKLKEIFDASGSPIADEGLKQIAEMYRIEATIRGRSAEERLSVRQEKTAPLVAAFGEWLAEKRARVSAKSRLGEKLTYIANHWLGLQVFLSDGRVEMDTNPVENRIRPLALTRKNALFAGHDEGAHAWARIASLIETAKINGVDPFAYMKAVLEALANGHRHSRLDDLLPWAFKASSSL